MNLRYPSSRRAHTNQAPPSPAAIRAKWRFDTIDRDDVYIVSFPRSGNTWLRFLLTALVHGDEVDAALVDRTVPDIHHSDPSVRPGVGPLWIKSHMPSSEAPSDIRVVYVVRRGLDAMTSYHRYLQARRRLAEDVDLSRFLAEDDVWPCRWAEHVGGWLASLNERSDDTGLLVRYEDLVASTDEELARIADFLGLRATPEQVRRAVAASDRERMQREELRSGAGTLNLVGSGQTRHAGSLGADWCRANASVLERVGYGL